MNTSNYFSKDKNNCGETIQNYVVVIQVSCNVKIKQRKPELTQKTFHLNIHAVKSYNCRSENHIIIGSTFYIYR